MAACYGTESVGGSSTARVIAAQNIGLDANLTIGELASIAVALETGSE